MEWHLWYVQHISSSPGKGNRRAIFDDAHSQEDRLRQFAFHVRCRILFVSSPLCAPSPAPPFPHENQLIAASVTHQRRLFARRQLSGSDQRKNRGSPADSTAKRKRYREVRILLPVIRFQIPGFQPVRLITTLINPAVTVRELCTFGSNE